MGRLYIVDAYNLVLQDNRLDRLVHEKGLEEARRVFRIEAENLARRAGCRIRLIYDGARGPFEHLDGFENEFVEASFTSTGEKADERVVAVAFEMVRRGAHVCVVSDDEEGVRRPLRGASVTLMGTREFLRLLRPPADAAAEDARAETLSRREREALARDMLSRTAAATPADEKEDDGWQEIPKPKLSPAVPGPTRKVGEAKRPAPPPVLPASVPAKMPASPPRASSAPPGTPSKPAAPARADVPDPARRLEAKKARGARKQEKRLALLQSLHPTHPSKKPKR